MRKKERRGEDGEVGIQNTQTSRNPKYSDSPKQLRKHSPSDSIGALTAS